MRRHAGHIWDPGIDLQIDVCMVRKKQRLKRTAATVSQNKNCLVRCEGLQ